MTCSSISTRELEPGRRTRRRRGVRRRRRNARSGWWSSRFFYRVDNTLSKSPGVPRTWPGSSVTTPDSLQRETHSSKISDAFSKQQEPSLTGGMTYEWWNDNTTMIILRTSQVTLAKESPHEKYLSVSFTSGKTIESPSWRGNSMMCCSNGFAPPARGRSLQTSSIIWGRGPLQSSRDLKYPEARIRLPRTL